MQAFFLTQKSLVIEFPLIYGERERKKNTAVVQNRIDDTGKCEDSVKLKKKPASILIKKRKRSSNVPFHYNEKNRRKHFIPLL